MIRGKISAIRCNLLFRRQVIVESCNMWSYDLDLRSIKLTVVKVVVRDEETCNNCLFVEVFNHFLDFSNEIFDFLANNL